MRGHDKRENDIVKLQDVCAFIKEAHAQAREALGEVTETFSEEDYLKNSGPDFVEKVVDSIRRRLDKNLSNILNPVLY